MEYSDELRGFLTICIAIYELCHDNTLHGTIKLLVTMLIYTSSALNFER